MDFGGQPLQDYFRLDRHLFQNIRLRLLKVLQLAFGALSQLLYPLLELIYRLEKTVLRTLTSLLVLLGSLLIDIVHLVNFLIELCMNLLLS